MLLGRTLSCRMLLLLLLLLYISLALQYLPGSLRADFVDEGFKLSSCV